MELSYLTGTQAHFTLIVQCQVFSDKKIGAEQFLLCVFVAISFFKKRKKKRYCYVPDSLQPISQNLDVILSLTE